MGLFNSLMKGMGFESDKKEEEKEKVEGTRYNNFENGVGKSFSTNDFKPNEINNTIPSFDGGVLGKNLIIYTPKDNNDIKILIECLRRKEACIVNLGELNSSDADKILQFLSGAVYALRGSIKRLQGDLFLMAPEGINIMTQK